MINKPPRKITLIYLQDTHDLFITDWNDTYRFSSLVQSIFHLSSTYFFLMDPNSKSIYDIPSFFSIENLSSGPFQVIPEDQASPQDQAKSQESSAADFGSRDIAFQNGMKANNFQGSRNPQSMILQFEDAPSNISPSPFQASMFTRDQQNLLLDTLINYFQRQGSNQFILPNELKQDESPNLLHQENVFELIEVLCSSRFRDIFDDHDFKHLLKQSRERNQDLLTSFSNFKLFNDESEFEQVLKQIAEQGQKKLSPSKIEMSFENKVKQSSLSKSKNSKSGKKKWNLQTYQGIRNFLQEHSKEGMLTIEESAAIILSAHPSNQNKKEFQEIIASIEQFQNPEVFTEIMKQHTNTFYYFEKLIIQVLKGYGSQVSLKLLEKFFMKKEVQIINQNKFNPLSPFCGAYMNLRSLGNLDQFLEILIANLKCFEEKEADKISPNNSASQVSSSSMTNSLREGQDINQAFAIQFSQKIFQLNEMDSIPESNENVSDLPSSALTNNGPKQSFFAYSQIAKEKNLGRRPTFCLGLNNGLVSKQKPKQEKTGTQITLSGNKDIQVINIINNFHQAKDQIEFDEKFFEALRKIRNSLQLSGKDDMLCERMYYKRHQEFIEVLENVCNDHSILKNESTKQEILQLIQDKAEQLKDEEEESPLSKSPQVKNRKDKYTKFQNVLNYLMDNKNLISLKERNTFNYLYIKEYMPVLSAYEVYSRTLDLSDFVETLKCIDKLNFFKNNLDYDEIESFDEFTKRQFSILFYLKNYITQEEEQVYEQLIRMGDTVLMEIYNQFKVKKNKQDFINKVIQYAQTRKTGKFNLDFITQLLLLKELGEAEMKILEEKQIQQNIHDKRKGIIKAFHSRLMEDIYHIELVEEVRIHQLVIIDSVICSFNQLIDNNDPIVNSIFEIYDYSLDKQDFVQNLTILYKRYFFKKLEDKTEEVLKVIPFSVNNVILIGLRQLLLIWLFVVQKQKVRNKVQNRDTTLVASFNTYMETKNDVEFKEIFSYLIN